MTPFPERGRVPRYAEKYSRNNVIYHVKYIYNDIVRIYRRRFSALVTLKQVLATGTLIFFLSVSQTIGFFLDLDPTAGIISPTRSTK